MHLIHSSSLCALLALGALHSRPVAAQVADSIARADSVHADSVRRAELARIRGEPRAGGDRVGENAPVPRRDARDGGGDAAGAAWIDVAVDMIADLSPEIAARRGDSRLLFNDVEAGAGARIEGWAEVGMLGQLDADNGITLREAAVTLGRPRDWWRLRIGRFAVPFGREAPMHRHQLLFPDYSRGIRELIGRDGSRGTGLLAIARRGTRLALTLGVVDRLGERVDSLVPPEPVDQSVLGLTGIARVEGRASLAGLALRGGWSGTTGKREQPLVCVYQGTVGPVPCPGTINAANTRITLVGLDGEAARGRFLVRAEWMRAIIGATDFPAFENDAFTPFYQGLSGTYDAGSVTARMAFGPAFAVGARGEFLQNPSVLGLNDGSAGAFLEFTPREGAVRFAGSYERRLASSNARSAMTDVERAATDQIVLRATVAVPRPTADRGRSHTLGGW